MPKGNKKIRDFIPAGSALKAEEVDALSPVDKKVDFVKAGETANERR